jgi:ectoine hydroxylase-related dioxygenase (phytanoyl-CoA dioxygenase family)
MVNEFNENGYVIYKNHIPMNFIEKVQNITIKARLNIVNNKLQGKSKDFGGFKHWDGLEMASMEYEELFDLYTSDLMYNIAKELLNTDDIYLFNDQIVVKLPNDGFIFNPHTDNGLGPNPELSSIGFYRSITCCWVLDDFTENNGPIVLMNKKTNEYETIYPKIGDIAVWDGETLHYSNENISDKPRRVWLQIYTTKDITNIPSMKNFKRYYGQSFIKGNTINELKNSNIKRSLL